MKTLFVCKERTSYGTSVGLINSAQFVCNYLNSFGIRSRVSIVQDYNKIDAVVNNYDPDYVFIEAIWVTPEKLKELVNLKRHSSREWVVRVHSRTPFLAHEGMALNWLYQYSRIGATVAPNTPDTTESFKGIGINSEYLPNIYWAPFYNNCRSTQKNRSDLHIGCFGAIRPMKNHLLQAIAAINFANTLNKTLYFHINAGRVEQKGDSVLANLRGLFYNQTRHKLVEHGWLDHYEFIKVVEQMDLGMQVSLSETFNIVCADMVNSLIPVVVSPQIEWMPDACKANPNSAKDMQEKLMYTYNNSESLINSSYTNLVYNGMINGSVWKNFLSRCV